MERRERVTRAWSAVNRSAGGADGHAEAEAVRDFQGGGLASLPEGESQSGSRRRRWAVDRGVRRRPEEEPVQALESDVLGELLSTAGADGGDTEAGWTGDQSARRAHRGRPNRPDGCGAVHRAGGGADFHTDSYGYRPGRSALQAVGVCRERCWQRDWVIDLDIKAFFDTLDHELVLRALRHHTDGTWIHLYVERWLVAPLQREDGSMVARDRGSPQGSAVSPLLANLFMHYAFDAWMARTLPTVQFERYVDDVVVHCKSERQARYVLQRITERLATCKLDVHPAKTHIVYCKDGRRTGSYDSERFDFLGYTFRPRRVRRHSEGAQPFVVFCPAVSDAARTNMSRSIRKWRLHLRSGTTLPALARQVNPIVRGWINYYGRYYPSMLCSVLDHINVYLVRWARRKFKRLRQRPWAAWRLITRIARSDPQLFAHWSLGVRPTAG